MQNNPSKKDGTVEKQKLHNELKPVQIESKHPLNQPQSEYENPSPNQTQSGNVNGALPNGKSDISNQPNQHSESINDQVSQTFPSMPEIPAAGAIAENSDQSEPQKDFQLVSCGNESY